MQAIQRTFQLLQLLGEQGKSVGVLHLSEQLHLPASTLHRLLSTLVEHGFVVQEADSRHYRLGPAVLRLAQQYLRENPLVSVAQHHLDSLCLTTGETTFLTVLLGDDAVCMATAESPRHLRFFMRVGQRMPYHAAASARAILAYQPESEVERLLRREGLEPFTQSTHRTVDDVMQELRSIRGRGFAICDEELERGVTAIAAPVRDASADVVASVAVVGPSERLQEERRTEILGPVLETTTRISESLGYKAL